MTVIPAPATGRPEAHEVAAHRPAGGVLRQSVSMRATEKWFGHVHANDDVDFDVRVGETVGLLGENGAGKSTLMGILYGLIQSDGGAIYVDETAVRIRSPRDALSLGIGMVQQHFALVPELTVLENVILGDEPARHGFLDRPSALARAEAILGVTSMAIDPLRLAGDLSVAGQQKVAILRALYRDVHLLILDEPTAVLAPSDADELFALMERLVKRQVGIVFISHNLRDVLKVTDRICVMRRGRMVASLETDSASTDGLAQLMMGRSRPGEMPVDRWEPADTTETVQLTELSVRAALGSGLRGLSLAIRSGEIMGVAGVDGNGQAELEGVFLGQIPAEQGSITVSGKDWTHLPTVKRLADGLQSIPADRQRQGLLARMSLEENILLGAQWDPSYTRGGRLNRSSIRRRSSVVIEEFDVRCDGPSQPARELSGGNQQKLVVGRALTGRPRVVVASQPTRGLDIAAAELVHRRLKAAATAGAAVLVISLDLDELYSLSDRIAVLFRGQVAGVFSADPSQRDEVGRVMVGARSDAQEAGS